MSRRGSELGPFPGINGVKAPFFSFAIQNAAKPEHLRMACKKLFYCKRYVVGLELGCKKSDHNGCTYYSFDLFGHLQSLIF